MNGVRRSTTSGAVKKMRVTNDINFEDDNEGTAVPFYEDSSRRIDVENFLFHLGYKESIVVLFMALSYKPKEISKIMGYSTANDVYQILLKMRNNYDVKNEF